MTARDIIAAADQIAGMRDALEAIVALHKPVAVCDRCGWMSSMSCWCGSPGAVVICEVCCTDGYGSRYASCESHHQHGEGQPICPTRAIASRALTEPNKNGNPRLSAAFSEWLMGWPQGWVTDPAIGISRNDQLRIVGNGVVPQCAAAALRYLLSVCEVAA